jgi:D-serine deaminase-like pyridoxal phosphate-dependent protein
MDMGMHRTGTKPADVTRLAAEVTQRRRMTYEGVQAYSGMVQHIQSFQERQRTYSLELVRLEHVLKDLNKSGLTPHTVSGGGTGTSAIDLSAGLFTESQAGSYALMDVEYNEIQMLREGRNPFKPAIFVRTYVAGLLDEHATVGAGFKAMSSDGPLPLAMEADLKYLFFGDEHGKLTGPGIERLRTGDVIDLMVPHCDPTVNLYDEIHVVDQDRLIEIWGVEARGYKWSSPQ